MNWKQTEQTAREAKNAAQIGRLLSQKRSLDAFQIVTLVSMGALLAMGVIKEFTGQDRQR